MKKNQLLFVLFFLLTSIGSRDLYGQALACNDMTYFSLDADGEVTIYPEDFVEGGPYPNNLLIYIYETQEGGEFIVLDCDDIGTLQLEVRDEVTGNSCWGNVLLEDKMSPVPYVTVGATVSLHGGGSITIEPDVIDIASFDNCSITSMSVTPSTFTEPGEYDVTLQLEDQSGNTDEAYTNLIVTQGEISCIENVTTAVGLIGDISLSAGDFVEGNAEYDQIEVSLDDSTFGDELVFNCDDIGTTFTVFTKVVQDGMETNCSTSLTIQDELPPVAIANDFTIDLASATDTYTLLTDAIDDGSYDNCSAVSLEISQTEFDIDDWGVTQVFLNVTDVSGNSSVAVSNVTVLVDGESTPMNCIDLSVEIKDSKNSAIEVWAVDFIANAVSFEDAMISLDPVGPFESSISASCESMQQNGVPVYIKCTKNGIEYNCESVLEVVDKAVPVPIVNKNVVLHLENGAGTITQDMVDNGSYDNCSGVELSLSKYEFTEEDAGVQPILVTVSDASGNISMTYSDIIVDNGNICNPYLVTFPNNITIFDPNGDVNDLSVEGLQTVYNYTFEDVHPYIDNDEECEDVIYSYTDQIVPLQNNYRVSRTWNAIDWDFLKVAVYQQFIYLRVEEVNELICKNEYNVSVLNGPVHVKPSDLLDGWVYNDDDFILKIWDENDNLIPDNILTKEHISDFNTYEITEIETGNTCTAFIDVNGRFHGCLLFASDMNAPSSMIQIEGYQGDLNDLTPEYLISNYGFSPSDVTMTWEQKQCETASSSYVDVVTENGDGTYTIQRTFTVTDWVACINNKESMWSSTQMIEVLVDPTAPTCNQFLFMSLGADGTAEAFAEIFIEGNDDYDVLEVSLDDVNFGASVSFDCDDNGQTFIVYVHIEDDGNSYDCTSQIQIEDKLPPSIVVKDFTIDLASESDTYTLQLEDVLDSSFDNCPGLEHTLSQTEFSVEDWGLNSVVTTVTDIANQSASATSTVTVLVDGQASPLECVSLTTVLTEPIGPVELWAVDFLINPEDFDQVLASLNPNGPFTEMFEAECGINAEQEYTVFIQATNSEGVFECTNELTIVDETAPIAIAEATIYLTLVNGEATLTTDMVDEGSYDNCTEVQLSLSKTLFTNDDIGTNTVTLTVTDLNGNESAVFSTVIVDNGSGCNLSDIVFPNDIEITDEDATLDNLSIQNLQDIYGYTFEEVHPYTVEMCDGIAYAYEDLYVDFPYGYKAIRTWTAVDWYTTEIITHVQILKLFTTFSQTIACQDSVTISVENGPVQVLPVDVLEGGPYNYDNMELLILDVNGFFLEDNIVDESLVGQILFYEVTDLATENMCWGFIEIEESTAGCALDGNDITYPLATIHVEDFDLDPALVTPEYLIENYGFEETEVTMTWPDDACLIVGITYEDVVFDYGGGSYMIVRNFTVIDWVTYDPGTDIGIWTFSQIINLGVDSGSLICDFLPRTAPVGDCESGHTLSDDVEWPADLEIADYRISPEELIVHSMVDVLDSEPSFYNNPDDYEASYIDLLIELQQTYLVIGRVWTVQHDIYDFSWTYNQQITVDITAFANLVTVNTGTDRVMPGVVINDEYVTDMDGKAQVDSDLELVATYEDDPLNGINILDLILMQKHIIGNLVLTENELLAADYRNDGDVKASDLTQLRKLLLGIIETGEDWRFYSKEIDSQIGIGPKGALLGIKPGDIDDSAILTGEEEVEVEGTFEMLDVLLNKGETYEVPVYLENDYQVFGLDFRAEIDTNLIEILDIQPAAGLSGGDFNVRADGVLISTSSNPEVVAQIGGSVSSPVLILSIQAKENSILSDAINFENVYSYLGDANLELVVLGGGVVDVIGTGTNSPELSSLKIYPNPATDYLNFDLANVDASGPIRIDIFSSTGRLMSTQTSNTRLDISRLPSGVYNYRIQVDEYVTHGKFITIK